jgi:hypothetical protein
MTRTAKAVLAFVVAPIAVLPTTVTLLLLLHLTHAVGSFGSALGETVEVAVVISAYGASIALVYTIVAGGIALFFASISGKAPKLGLTPAIAAVAGTVPWILLALLDIPAGSTVGVQRWRRSLLQPSRFSAASPLRRPFGTSLSSGEFDRPAPNSTLHRTLPRLLPRREGYTSPLAGPRR